MKSPTKETNNKILTLVSVIALIIAFSTIIFMYVIPQAKYDKAETLLEAGKYEEARELFDSFDYKNSKVRALQIGLMNFEKGDTVHYGSYDWLILDKQENELLLISKEILLTRDYDFKDANVTWENSRIRPWLNFDFYEESFSETERRNIIERENQNPVNNQYHTWGGGPTSDRVYLLSIDEVLAYFPDNESRECTYNGDPCWWWLRSPGNDQYYAANVSVTGAVVMFGNNVGDTYGGVRPVIRVNTI